MSGRSPLGASLAALLLLSAMGCGSTRAQKQAEARPLAALPTWLARRPQLRIVFTDALADEFGRVDSIRVDGSGLRVLARDASQASASPDGKRIAYWGENIGPLGEGGVVTARVDGSHVRVLVRETGGGEWLYYDPAWSPDGRKLAYVGTRSCSCCSCGGFIGTRVYTINPDGSARKPLVEILGEPGPNWVDAGTVVEGTGTGFALVDVAHARIGREITPTLLRGESDLSGPAVSPDGRRLAYTACVNADCSRTVLHLVRLDGKPIGRIRGGRSAAFTPHGDLLYSCCGQPGLRGNHNRIMLQAARGGRARPITPASISADEPAWLG